MKNVKILFVLFLVFAAQVDNQPQKNNNTAVPSSLNCKKITCFGSANCTLQSSTNTTRCVPNAQKNSSIEDVIRKNLNSTDDYLSDNSTLTNSTRDSNNTSPANLAMFFPVVLPLTVTFMR